MHSLQVFFGIFIISVGRTVAGAQRAAIQATMSYVSLISLDRVPPHKAFRGSEFVFVIFVYIAFYMHMLAASSRLTLQNLTV